MAPVRLRTAAASAVARSSGGSTRFRRWREHCCARQCSAASSGSSGAGMAPRTLPLQPWQRTAVAAAGGAGGQGGQPETLADVMGNIMQQLMQMQGQQGAVQRPSGAHVHVEQLSYQPPGSPAPLLSNVCMTLPPNQMGLVFGRSGAGKTTLLHLVAGLAQPTSGTIAFSGPPPPCFPPAGFPPAGGSSSGGSGSVAAASGLTSEERMAQAGLVFQFPERHFIGRTMSAELTVGWPVAPEAMITRTALAQRTHQVLAAVGLTSLPLDVPLAHLSDGYKRRVALAVQLVRRPRLLLLDEPLAGLDWRTRSELVSLLSSLKSECSMLVVSHDLRELAPLVDCAWEMRPGGRLEEASVDALPTLG